MRRGAAGLACDLAPLVVDSRNDGAAGARVVRNDVGVRRRSCFCRGSSRDTRLISCSLLRVCLRCCRRRVCEGLVCSVRRGVSSEGRGLGLLLLGRLFAASDGRRRRGGSAHRSRGRCDTAVAEKPRLLLGLLRLRWCRGRAEGALPRGDGTLRRGGGAVGGGGGAETAVAENRRPGGHGGLGRHRGRDRRHDRVAIRVGGQRRRRLNRGRISVHRRRRLRHCACGRWRRRLNWGPGRLVRLLVARAIVADEDLRHIVIGPRAVASRGRGSRNP
mmetsp:Transcript_62074/g.149535  ORF Transcript_62074/g.149535 Transcript_62074/m.149535 type:complete len:274 (-) Transcript_62074:1347-2168(-)